MLGCMISHPPQLEASDEELAVRRDLAELYGRYARRLLAFLSSRGVASADLDDLHQEVWLRVYRGLAERPFAGHFRGWLFQIARNLVVDHARRPVRGLPLPDDEFHDSGPGPAEVLTRRELFEQLERCLGRLEQREAAVVRARTAGLGYEELCDSLGIDRNAAYKIFYQATARLAECMKRAGP